MMPLNCFGVWTLNLLVTLTVTHCHTRATYQLNLRSGLRVFSSCCFLIVLVWPCLDSS